MSKCTQKRPGTKAVATRKSGGTTYKLYPNTELWTCGKHGFFCGYVSDPQNIDIAIDDHEQEMECLIAQARREFGL